MAKLIDPTSLPVCPTCTLKWDPAGFRRHDPGAIIVCINCGEMLVLTKKKMVRKMKPADMEEMSEEAVRAQMLVRARGWIPLK